MAKIDDVYRQVSGYEGLYEVSNTGKVRSISRKTAGRWGSTKTSPGRVLKGSISNIGYRRVVLCKNGIKKNHSVHRLVAEAFIPNPLNKTTVNHINGDKQDNRVENLEWNTPSEQIQHAKANGLLKPAKGLNHPKTKLTHCKQGHEFTKENTYINRGNRNCKKCLYEANIRHRTKLKDYYGISDEV